MLPSLCSNLLRHSAKYPFRMMATVNLGGHEVELITSPIVRDRNLPKKKRRPVRGKKMIKVSRPGKLLVSCDDRRLNMYTNEFPTKFEPPTLASQTWTSRKSPGRYLTIHATRENPSTNYVQDENDTFKSIGLSNAIIQSLSNIEIQSPTNIQRKVIPVILQGENVMLAAETGSGKTFGYFLPIANKLLESTPHSSVQGPSAIVITPSKELSLQFLRMSRKLDLPLKISSLDEIWAERKKRKILDADVFVGTPVLILAALRRRLLSLNQVKYAVVDECDTLLDASFSDYVCSILARLNIHKGKSKPLLDDQETQLILSSATFPQYAGEALEDIVCLSELSSISTGYMHRISPHVTHKFLRVRPSEKLPTLIHILSETPPDETVLIFCNKKSTVRFLANELIFNGFSVDMIYSGANAEEGNTAVKNYEPVRSCTYVCTDLSSRGLDTQNVTHVVNYDFPGVASDYIHRSGRVGRVGQVTSGKVTSLISRKWEIPLLMKIEEAARRRERIEGVSADIKSYHNQRWDDRAGIGEIEIEQDSIAAEHEDTVGSHPDEDEFV